MSKSIEFPGTAGNRYDYSINNNQDLAGGYTMLIVQRMLAANGSWQSLLESESSAPAPRPSIGRQVTDNDFYFSDSVGLKEAPTVEVLSSQNWTILAATRPAGAAQTVRAHYFQVGGSPPTHENFPGTASNETAYATGKFIIAGDDDPANIRVAAWAIWDGTALADGDFDSIATALTTQSILDLSPTACFDSENDLMLTDLAGTLPGTLVGTITESADGPTDWLYFGESAEPEVTFKGDPRRGVASVA